MSKSKARPSFQSYRPRTADAPLALEGVRVLDFSRVLSGPFCTQILADLGADVVKVEQPDTGDQVRNLSPGIGPYSTYFWALNRNKRSITLDLALQEGRDVVLDMLSEVDVLVENYTARVMRKFDLDYESIKERFPKLIYCSVSGYGRTSPLADVPAYDSMIAAESGQISFNCNPGERPVVNSVPIIDFMAAKNASIGILAALRARDLYGKGQFIDIAMFDSAMACLAYRGTDYFAAGENPVPTGRVSKTSAPGGEFDVLDGSVWIMITSDKMYQRLCTQVLDAPHLLEDPRFVNQASRHKYIDELNAAVQEAFRPHKRDDVVAEMRAAGLPAGSVRTVKEAFHAHETAERGIMSDLPHPEFDRIPNISSVFRHMTFTPAIDPVPGPYLGEHTEEVLKEIAHYDDLQISELEAQQVFSKIPISKKISNKA